MESTVSFLFPLYLLGAAAIAVPILLHLRRRPPKEHIEFGSLMFLEKTPERVTRRTRLEQILLLALRCLAILLLAFAFGRPFLDSIRLPSEASTLTRAILLVDRSASMRREGLREAAAEAAREAAQSYEAGAEVGLALFDEHFDLAADLPTLAELGPGARGGAVEALLAEEKYQPSWRGTNLGAAMTQAANLLLSADATRPADRREIVLIGDFQTGAKRELLQENPWPGEVKVRCIPIATLEKGNVSLTLAATPPRSNIDEAEVYRVRIMNSAESASANLALGWKDRPETTTEVLVAPGTSRIVTSSPRPAGTERGTLIVSGDTHLFDNEVHVSPVQPRPLRVRFLGKESDAESAGSPLFYLRRALQPTPVLQPIVSSSESVEELDPNATEIVVAPGPWNPAAGAALHRFAEKGGLILALPSSDTTTEAFAALTGRAEWKLSEAAVAEFSLLADLDFEHPVLEPFARAQIRDFTKIRFWKHRLLEMGQAPFGDGTRILATFDGEAPAFLEHRIGKGAVFAFLSGWRPEESQLALSSKFVPLLFSIFDHAGYSIRSAPTHYVGETSYPAPGFYEEPQESGEPRLVSVNLDPSEGRTDPFDPRVEFAALGIPLLEELAAATSELSAAQKLRVESEQKEAQQKLWKWLVFAALLVLILETWFAGRRAAASDPSLEASAKPTT
jgi:hypothetical protein